MCFYDPTTGTFLSPDPIDGTPGTADEANPYDYVGNDPVNFTDPLGLSRVGDGAMNAGSAGAACDAVHGRLVWWGDSGTQVCMEPGGSDGAACWPPSTPGGKPIVMHGGSCSVVSTEIVCDHGAWVPGLNRICRNGDAITGVLTIVAVGALTVASAGAFAAVAVEIGGTTGVLVGAGAGGGGAGALISGGGIVLSPAAAEALGIGSASLLAAAGISTAANNGGDGGWPVQEGGNCRECADAIQREIGGEVRTIRPGGGEPRLGPSEFNPAGDWSYHEVVLKNGRIYDSFTGRAGMTIDEYKALFDYAEAISFGF